MVRRRFSLILLGISALFVLGCQGIWPLGGDSEKFVSANIESATNGTGNVDYLSTVGGAMADAPIAGQTESSDVSREIEEADLVKLIDHQLFVLNRSRGLRIVDVTDWSRPTMRGTVAIQGNPLEMYVNNGVATIVAVNNSLCRLDAQGQPVPQTGSMVYTVDVSNADAPQVVGTFEIDGSVSETRRVGDVVYLAGLKSWSYMGYYSNYSPEGFVASVYVADPTKVQLVDQKTFPGIGDIIHATQNAIFVTGMNWSNGMSTVQYVDISDPAGTITLRGTCQVPGAVLNRFALDAQDGVLRVVANRDWWWSDDAPQTEESEGGETSSSNQAKEGEPKYGVRLYTFDISNPDSIQSLGEVFIIKNESLQAVKFDDAKAYVVTYEQRDPLWVIDLSDPSNPAITGYLEAPGYSTFLEPDGNLLVAVGIDDQDGWRACVMLYDVSDAKNPVELDRQALGGNYSYSTATYDDKAFKVVPEAKLVLVPFESWANGEYRSQLQMLDYSNNQLVKLAAVEQRGSAIRSNVDLASNVLWVLGEQVLQTFNIQDRNTPQSLAVLPMAENVLAWRAFGQYGLRVITAREDWQNPAVELQTLSADSPNGHQTLGSQTFDMQFYNTRLIVIDDSLSVLTGVTGEGQAKLITIDTTALPEIRVRAERTLDVYLGNFYGYFGMDYMYNSMAYMNGPNLTSMVNMLRTMPLWQNNQDNPMVLSNRGLVFIGVPQTESYGSSTRQLNIVSLADPTDPKVVSQVDVTEGEFDMVLQIGASGTTVFNTVGQVMPDSLWQFLTNRDTRLNVMYSVRLIDCSDLANPQTQDPVNVPGITIGLRDDYLFTIDPQWSEDQIFTRFCSVKISGGQAQLISSVDLPVGEPAPVRFVSDAAIVTLTKSYWYGPYPIEAESIASPVAKETECSMGSTRVVSVNLADPANLALASDTEYAGLGCIAGVADAYVIGQAWSSYQGLILKVGDDQALSLSKVIDLPPAVSDVSSANGTIYICCGPAGVVTVNP